MNINNDVPLRVSSEVVPDVPETAADALPIHTEQIPSESNIGGAVSTGRRQEEAGR